jgi:hypothetical protein
VGHGGQFDAILPGESLVAAWDVEEVLVGVCCDED